MTIITSTARVLVVTTTVMVSFLFLITIITTARVLVVTTTVMVIAATKLFLRRRSRGTNGGVVPNIPDASPSSSSPSSSAFRWWEYDVFISFRGEDTRNTFVGHLYSALNRHGIVTYKDDVTLERGDTIAPALKSAIRESHIALIIFSENYPDSSWCLDELSPVMEDSGQIVIPIFYNVTGKFDKTFSKHKLFKNKNKVKSWTNALVGASNIPGLEPKQVAYGHEARCIKEIVSYILSSTSSLSRAAPYPSASRSWKYDVFISFRGEDTRNTLVAHLYSALQRHGIVTYKDDVTLERGDTIAPALLSAIRESRIALIIFSENYADSSWCLDELSHIMEDSGQIVFLIFYYVDPSDVRKQTGQYGKSFAKHRLSKNKNKVESWTNALVEATNIARLNPKQVAYGHEARCVQEIVSSILDKLASEDLEDGGLVGMRTRLQQLRSHLRIGSGGVRMVGICGVRGGGKTTLAVSIYLELKESGQFDGCCFVDSIREAYKQHDGLKLLQGKILSTVYNQNIQVQSVELGKEMIERMLCHRNVLIVLDDVDDLEQLEALAGCHEWFGDGSRILITTRDEHLLTTHRVDVVSHISLLSHDEALQLFKRHAFCEDNPVEDYNILSQLMLPYAAGLPLALVVLGFSLYDRHKVEWLHLLEILKYHPEKDIMKKLGIKAYANKKPKSSKSLPSHRRHIIFYFQDFLEISP